MKWKIATYRDMFIQNSGIQSFVKKKLIMFHRRFLYNNFDACFMLYDVYHLYSTEMLSVIRFLISILDFSGQ